MNTDTWFDIPDDEFQIILSNIPTPIQQIHEIDEPEYVIKNDITIYDYSLVVAIKEKIRRIYRERHEEYHREAAKKESEKSNLKIVKEMEKLKS